MLQSQKRSKNNWTKKQPINSRTDSDSIGDGLACGLGSGFIQLVSDQ